MATIKEQQHKWLLKKFHTLCLTNGLTVDEKLSLLWSYGVESSKDLDNRQLTEICERLQTMADPKAVKRDKMRKRVLGAIGGWLRLVDDSGAAGDIEYIKSIACRASGYSSFNKIPLERLGNLYAAFLKKQKDAKSVQAVCGEIVMDKLVKENGIYLN